jgi:hypothetical protein
MNLRQATLEHLMPTASEHRGAATALGERHPLTTALARNRTVARQTVVAAAVVPAGVAAMVAHLALGPVVTAATALVVVAFAAVWTSTRRTLVDAVHELIVEGDRSLMLPTVLRERRRLDSRKERERLARSLEQALDDAWGWYRRPPRPRGLPGVVCLRDATPEARAVIRQLRSGQVAVRGVAMTARLLMDGLRSPLYSGDRRRLREELARIRFALESKPAALENTRHWQAAA